MWFDTFNLCFCLQTHLSPIQETSIPFNSFKTKLGLLKYKNLSSSIFCSSNFVLDTVEKIAGFWSNPNLLDRHFKKIWLCNESFFICTLLQKLQFSRKIIIGWGWLGLSNFKSDFSTKSRNKSVCLHCSQIILFQPWHCPNEVWKLWWSIYKQ